MTTDPLALLKELHAKTTSGDWSTEPFGSTAAVFAPLLKRLCYCYSAMSDINDEEAKNNAAWIAAVHNAFPELARRIETLEAENARLVADRGEKRNE